MAARDTLAAPETFIALTNTIVEDTATSAAATRIFGVDRSIFGVVMDMLDVDTHSLQEDIEVAAIEVMVTAEAAIVVDTSSFHPFSC